MNENEQLIQVKPKTKTYMWGPSYKHSDAYQLKSYYSMDGNSRIHLLTKHIIPAPHLVWDGKKVMGFAP